MSYLDRIFETAKEVITIPNDINFAGGVNFAGSMEVAGLAEAKQAVNATLSSTTLDIIGFRGQVAVKAGATLTAGTRAGGNVVASLVADVQLPATAVIGTDGIISGLAFTGNLGGTHTGKCSLINVMTPAAGMWDYFLDFGADTGAVASNTNAIGANSTYRIRCRVASTEFDLIGVGV